MRKPGDPLFYIASRVTVEGPGYNVDAMVIDRWHNGSEYMYRLEFRNQDGGVLTASQSQIVKWRGTSG